MRFLADENIPRATVEELRVASFDISSVAEESAGANDWDVLTRAEREGRVLITFDKDFGEMVSASVPAPLLG